MAKYKVVLEVSSIFDLEKFSDLLDSVLIIGREDSTGEPDEFEVNNKEIKRVEE